MPVKRSQRAAADKWDSANMAYQTIKVKKTLLDDFKSACVARGDKVNTVLRHAMENYVNGDSLTFHELMTIKTVLEDDLKRCEQRAQDSKLTAKQRSDERRCAEIIRPCYEKVLRAYETLVDEQKRP